ncbi:MAG: hypothetical protein ACOYJC_03975 [Christensenellales bacterium]|jgi:hypothetical protein
MTEMTLGLMLMGYGLIGVFFTLILFYFCAKLFVWIAGRKKNATSAENS